MTEKDPDSTELLGWFWPPNDDTTKLPGRLTTDSGGSMTLDVINQPRSSDETRQTAPFLIPPGATGLPWNLSGSSGCLLGVVSGTSISGSRLQDVPITLHDCRCLTTGSFPHQPSRLSFIANAAYTGVALQPNDTLICSEVGCRAEGIEGWLHPSGPTRLKGDFLRPSHSLTATAEVADLGRTEVNMEVLSGFTREKGNVLEIREAGHMTLRPHAHAPWDRLRGCLYRLHRLIRFALNAPCRIGQVQVELSDGTTVEIVEQRMRASTKRPYRPGRVSWNALFTADPNETTVVGPAAKVLRRWLETPREADGALLRLDALMASSEYVDSQVASICGAGELWCAQILGKDARRGAKIHPLSRAAKKTIDRVLDDHGWPQAQRRRVRQVLDTPNTLSTGEKVRGTFDPIERELMETPANAKCQVSSGLLELRHALSHGSVSTTTSLRDMYTLVRRARAILKLRVLEYLGVDWRTVAKYNRTIRWELGLGEDQSHALPYPVDEATESPNDRPAEVR